MHVGEVRGVLFGEVFEFFGVYEGEPGCGVDGYEFLVGVDVGCGFLVVDVLFVRLGCEVVGVVVFGVDCVVYDVSWYLV